MADKITEVGARLVLSGRSEFVAGMKDAAKANTEAGAAAKAAAEQMAKSTIESDRYDAAVKRSTMTTKLATEAERARLKAVNELTAANALARDTATKRADAEAKAAGSTDAAAIADAKEAVAADESAAANQRAAKAAADRATAVKVAATEVEGSAAAAAAAEKAGAEESVAANDAAAGAAERRATMTRGLAVGVVGLTAVAGVVAVKMAADYQTATTKLVTSGGVAEDQIAGIRAGMLTMAGQVGVSATDLATAMYKITSAGYDGAAGLGMLKAAEQGAKAEQADGTKVADALSSAMRDYYPAVINATDVTRTSADVMSKMVAATTEGKLTFDALAGGMSTILPIASQAHISLNDVLATLASMTVHGVTVDQATQQMANAIQHLQTPTMQMSSQMAALGLSSDDVKNKLGERGLSGTLQYLSGKVTAAMPPGSDKVLLDLNDALKASDPAVQALGRSLLDGTITAGEYVKSAKTMTGIQKDQASQFGALVNRTHQLGNETLTGGDIIKSYASEMAGLTGTQSGLQVALETTGQNADYTNKALADISKTTADGAGNVKGWADVQGTFNQQLAQAKDGLGALFIVIGTKALPVLTSFVGKIDQGITYLTEHKSVLLALGIVFGTVFVFALAIVVGWLGAMAVAVVAATGEFALIVTAVAAFVVGIVYLYNNVQWFHDLVNVVFANVKKYAVVAFDAVVEAGTYVVDWLREHWPQIQAVAMTVFRALGTAAKAVGVVLMAVWKGITEAAMWAFTNIVAPIGRALMEIVGLFIPVVNAIREHWDGIVLLSKFALALLVGAVRIAWGAIHAVLTVGLAVLKLVFDVAWNALVMVVSVAWDLITGIVSIAWDLLMAVVRIGRDSVLLIINVFLDILTLNWGKAWTDIKDFVINIWNDIWGGLSAIMHDIAGMFSNAFSDIAGGIKNIVVGLWGDIKSMFITGINATIGLINGFLGAINSIAGAVGISLNLHIDPIGGGGGGLDGNATMGGTTTGGAGAMAGLERGGQIGGGFRTNGPQVLVGEGNAAYPEYVIPTDPMHRGRAANLFSSLGADLGMPAMADGGIIGSIGSGISSVAGAVGSAVSSAVDAAESVAKMGLQAALDTVWPKMATSGNGIIDIVPGAANTVRGKIIDFIVGKDSANKTAAAAAGNVGGGSGAVPTGDHLAMINMALAADGIPADQWPRWQAGMDTLIGRESGWNPGAQNDWDSNAAAGMPSGGLTQTILPTFNANRNPALSANMFDPVANIAASINYIRSRYGDISAVQQANPSLPPLGYAAGGVFPYEGRYNGGMVNSGQPYVVGEMGPEVFVPQSSGTMLASGVAPKDSPAAAGTPVLEGLGGSSVVFQQGAIVIHESGDARATYEAVRRAVQDQVARQ